MSELDIVFKPNLLSEDGTASIRTSATSKDGKYFAYGISRSVGVFFNSVTLGFDPQLFSIGIRLFHHLRPAHNLPPRGERGRTPHLSRRRSIT